MEINKKEKLESLGRKIRELRADKNWSQRGMADKCNIDSADIGRIERGQIDIRYTTILQLAQVLEVTPCKLMDC